MTRRKFTSKFKTKVVLELLKERYTLAELAQKFDIAPQQLSNWKREFLNNADSVFEKGGLKAKDSGDKDQRDKLLKVIGELKVENDFLKEALH